MVNHAWGVKDLRMGHVSGHQGLRLSSKSTQSSQGVKFRTLRTELRLNTKLILWYCTEIKSMVSRGRVVDT
jgi:hypothetical protein